MGAAPRGPPSHPRRLQASRTPPPSPRQSGLRSGVRWDLEDVLLPHFTEEETEAPKGGFTHGHAALSPLASPSVQDSPPDLLSLLPLWRCLLGLPSQLQAGAGFQNHHCCLPVDHRLPGQAPRMSPRQQGSHEDPSPNSCLLTLPQIPLSKRPPSGQQYRHPSIPQASSLALPLPLQRAQNPAADPDSPSLCTAPPPPRCGVSHH